jgi:tetratricopeptide (TPR) repeat protein
MQSPGLTVFAAALICAVAFTATSSLAVDSRDPVMTGPQLQSAQPGGGTAKPAKKATTRKKKAPAKKSEQDFIGGYHHAHDLIYKKQDYTAAIVALRALNHDDNADVANLIGFSSRKLGRTEDAKVWYEKALVADPKHTRTWQYYGMWHLEQGNRLKAEEHLDTIKAICGADCEDYRSLLAALNGNGVY